MPPADPGNRNLRETRDISPRAAVLFGVLLMAGTLLSLFGMKWLFDAFQGRIDAAQQAPMSLVRGERTPLTAPEPRLQMDPIGDLARWRARQEAHLTSYGWVDREKGIARIPVEQAIELILERGLPVREDDTP